MAVDPFTASQIAQIGIPIALSFFGGGSKAKSSGAFTGELATAFQKLLLDRIQGDVTDSEAFKSGAGALEDIIARERGSLRSATADRARREGFGDSGQVRSDFAEIDRNALGAHAQGLNQLLLELDRRRIEGVLPFLTGISGEHLGRASINAQPRNDFFSNFLTTAGSGFGKGLAGTAFNESTNLLGNPLGQ